MANASTRKTAKTARSTPRSKHSPGPNGDAGGVRLRRDVAADLGDALPEPTTDFVLLDDDDWIEDAR